MPRVKVMIPDELLQKAATAAQEQGRSIDELYAASIERYVETNRSASPGSLRSRHGIPGRSPSLTIEIPEALFQSAEKLAKRLGKRRDVLYSEALARHVASSHPASSALDRGHDLPDGAQAPRRD